ncbi:hypothetical protein [Embleya sp. NPDC059237]
MIRTRIAKAAAVAALAVAAPVLAVTAASAAIPVPAGPPVVHADDTMGWQ